MRFTVPSSWLLILLRQRRLFGSTQESIVTPSLNCRPDRRLIVVTADK
jgi:hypothetical protein